MKKNKYGEWEILFRVPIYNPWIRLIVTNDLTATSKRYPDRDSSKTTVQEEAFCHPDWPEYCLVLQPTTSLGFMDHEIGHIARDIMETIGFKIKADEDGQLNDEPLAYLDGYLTDEIHRRLRKIPEASQIPTNKRLKKL